MKALIFFVAAVLAGYLLYRMVIAGEDSAFSDIKADEVVVFFNTTASYDEASKQWRVPIHGWIYEPQNSSARMALFSKILKESYDLVADGATRGNFQRRLNLMIADNERGKRIVIDVAGRTVTLPSSAENGHFKDTLTYADEDLQAYSQNGIVPYSAVTRPGDGRSFHGEVRLVGPTGISVISDIDDTVKITSVTDRRAMLEHTFLLDFSAVPGMAASYRNWASQGASLYFVSSSPWQLYPPLKEFLDREQFPWSGLTLKPVRFRDETLLDLFKKGTETKPSAITAILEDYPRRYFVLVGDSGEQDPEVYAGLLRRFPERILKILIRNVTDASSDDERFSAVFYGIDRGRWQLFADPPDLDLPKIPREP